MNHSSLNQRLLGAALFMSLASGAAAAAPVCQKLEAQQRDAILNSYFPMGGVQSYRAILKLDTGNRDRWKTRYETTTKRREQVHALIRRMFPDWRINPYSEDYGRCRMEAAFAIYEDRVQRFGAEHPYVLQWLAAQQVVLSHCRDMRDSASAPLPPATQFTDPAMTTLQAQDRRYQEATILFYSTGRAEAALAYDAIAQDLASPLRPLATYMGATIRTEQLVDRMWSGGERHDIPQAEVTLVLNEMQAILADPALTDVHALTVSLQGYASYHLADPALRQAQVDEALQMLRTPEAYLNNDPAAMARYEHAAEDIGDLMRRYGESPTIAAALDRAAESDSLAQWLLFPAPSVPSFGFGNWSLSHKNGTPEGYDALLHSTTNRTILWQHQSWYASDHVDALGEAVREEIARVQYCGDEQALALLPTDYYMLVKQTWARAVQGKPEAFADAEALLRDYPFRKTDAWRTAARDSLQYLTATGYLARARRLRDLLELPGDDATDSGMRALLIGLAEDAPHLARALSGRKYLQGAELLNGLSIAAMWQLAEIRELDMEKRALLARTAWTRLYALGRPITPVQDRLMRELNPEFVKSWRSRAGDAAQPGNLRVLQDMLASPGFNIEIQYFSRLSQSGNDNYTRPAIAGMDYFHHNDGNWWCALWLDRLARDREAGLRRIFSDKLEEKTGRPWETTTMRDALAPAIRESFLLQAQSPAELDALSRIDCAPKTLSNRVITWVRGTPAGVVVEGQDEALANAVLSTRYGCARQGGHGEYSRAAFELLKSRFPNSAAAQRTKYWFDCPPYGDGCKAPDPLNTPSRR